jgi:hypothetical protein
VQKLRKKFAIFNLRILKMTIKFCHLIWKEKKIYTLSVNFLSDFGKTFLSGAAGNFNSMALMRLHRIKHICIDPKEFL